MNFRPIAGIDVSKIARKMVILSPSNEVIARIKIHNDPILVLKVSLNY